MSDTFNRTGVQPAPRPAGGLSFGALARRPEMGSFLGMVIVFAFFAVFGGINFVSAGGTASWLNVASEIGIVALPVGLLMIAGELDISIGSVIPAASMTVAIVSGTFELPLILGVAAALGLGLLVGLINGVLVIRTGVPSLIVTLGSLFAVAGLTLGLSVIITGSTGVPIQAGPVGKAILGQFIAGIFQVTILWWLLAIAVVGFLLHVSRWGNWVFALGGDKVSARNEGIPIDRLVIQLFMGSGFAAAFVGVSQAILYNSAQVSTGQSFIFNSIISVVIGGVLLTGGFGSVIGIVFGTITFAIVNQGIFYTGFDANWASLIIGVLLLLAVLLNNTFRKAALNYSPRKAK
ncbi:ABC transporter permease [Rubellimicrobium rubrum]|uniref:Xylose transport system permease protein XylH n=1 Tax=Rubellimicrobium rubrum TaxID=2585369 RepID=A0A5C4MQ93_9RHOB|nr:ABC transporter permease [Rubellimicrobium rubrum]TNC46482.1 ABC transporter permease [Rubellimicrobium rubrum]